MFFISSVAFGQVPPSSVEGSPSIEPVTNPAAAAAAGSLGTKPDGFDEPKVSFELVDGVCKVGSRSFTLPGTITEDVAACIFVGDRLEMLESALGHCIDMELTRTPRLVSAEVVVTFTIRVAGNVTDLHVQPIPGYDRLVGCTQQAFLHLSYAPREVGSDVAVRYPIVYSRASAQP